MNAAAPKPTAASKPPAARKPTAASKPPAARRRSWSKVAVPLALVGVVGTAILLLYRVDRSQPGTISNILVEDLGDERLITVVFTQHATRGNSGGTSTRMFSSSGRSLGRMARNSTIVTTIGGARLIRKGDALTLVDRRTGDEVADVQQALDETYGRGKHRFRGVTAAGVEVQLEDGRTAELELRSLLPAPLRDAPEATRRTWITHPEHCSTDPYHYRDGHKERLTALKARMTLLRPRLVHAPATSSNAEACSFDTPRPSLLALHRSTAFGDDGAYLLSALPFDDLETPVWTLDLTAAAGGGTKELRLLDARTTNTDLCFWIVREQRSLREACLHKDTGALRFATVIFLAERGQTQPPQLVWITPFSPEHATRALAG